jgi:hypothetical protein
LRQSGAVQSDVGDLSVQWFPLREKIGEALVWSFGEASSVKILNSLFQR